MLKNVITRHRKTIVFDKVVVVRPMSTKTSEDSGLLDRNLMVFSGGVVKP